MTLTLEAEDKTLRPWPECREAEEENEVKIWAGLEVVWPNTLWVISGTGSCGSEDPAKSVKALKKIGS